MKSINIRPDDLPENFVTHISHMKTHDRSWHYDPSIKDNSALERGNIQIDDDVLAYLDAYSKDLPVEISSSIYDGEHHNYKANDSAWGKLDHVYHGYTEHNTQSRYMRKTYEESSSQIQNIIDQTGLKFASAGVIRLSPGNIIPWHYDRYHFFHSSQEASSENLKPERHIIFPFAWDWGHIYQIGNNVLSNWGPGSRYTWPNLRYHLTANIGISDFIMIAVTGVSDNA